jgi:hypothetical protein
MMNKVIMPKELTAENGAKSLMIGEFFETREIENPEDEYETRIEKIPISWTSIKGIYKKVVEHFGRPIDNPSAMTAERLAKILREVKKDTEIETGDYILDFSTELLKRVRIDEMKKMKYEYTLPLLSVDFEDNTITLQATPEVMAAGFHVGNVVINLQGVQEKLTIKEAVEAANKLIEECLTK